MLDYAQFQAKPVDAFGWVRDPLWAPLPTPNSNEIYILAAVFNDSSNFAALAVTVTGGYTVDWGDGTVENFASAAAAEHTYTFSDADITHQYNSRTKQVVIKITTQAANDITAFSLTRVHSQSGWNARSPWLEILVNTPACTSIDISSGSSSRSLYLENVEFYALGAITTLQNVFDSAFSLRRVIFPDGSLQSVTSLVYAFNNCYSLTYMTFPAGSLQSSLTSISAAFFGCANLKRVVWPDDSLGSVTNASNLFTGCNSLTYAYFPNGALVSVTNISTMFSTCSALTWVRFASGSLGSVTSATSPFNACNALRRIENFGCPITVSLQDCNLGPAELDEIYTALPSVTSKTITVTGNWGISGDTPSIATAKGWTVTGS